MPRSGATARGTVPEQTYDMFGGSTPEFGRTPSRQRRTRHPKWITTTCSRRDLDRSSLLLARGRCKISWMPLHASSRENATLASASRRLLPRPGVTCQAFGFLHFQTRSLWKFSPATTVRAPEGQQLINSCHHHHKSTWLSSRPARLIIRSSPKTSLLPSTPAPGRFCSRTGTSVR